MSRDPRYLVVWTVNEDGRYTDYFNVHDDYDAALKDYEALRANDRLYTLSLCVPIKSTDYDSLTLFSNPRTAVRDVQAP